MAIKGGWTVGLISAIGKMYFDMGLKAPLVPLVRSGISGGVYGVAIAGVAVGGYYYATDPEFRYNVNGGVKAFSQGAASYHEIMRKYNYGSVK